MAKPASPITREKLEAERKMRLQELSSLASIVKRTIIDKPLPSLVMSYAEFNSKWAHMVLGKYKDEDGNPIYNHWLTRIDELITEKLGSGIGGHSPTVYYPVEVWHDDKLVFVVPPIMGVASIRQTRHHTQAISYHLENSVIQQNFGHLNESKVSMVKAIDAGNEIHAAGRNKEVLDQWRLLFAHYGESFDGEKPVGDSTTGDNKNDDFVFDEDEFGSL